MVSCLADQLLADESFGRVYEDEVKRLKADNVPEPQLLHSSIAGDYIDMDERR